MMHKLYRKNIQIEDVVKLQSAVICGEQSETSPKASLCSVHALKACVSALLLMLMLHCLSHCVASRLMELLLRLTDLAQPATLL